MRRLRFTELIALAVIVIPSGCSSGIAARSGWVVDAPNGVIVRLDVDETQSFRISMADVVNASAVLVMPDAVDLWRDVTSGRLDRGFIVELADCDDSGTLIACSAPVVLQQGPVATIERRVWCACIARRDGESLRIEAVLVATERFACPRVEPAIRGASFIDGDSAIALYDGTTRAWTCVRAPVDSLFALGHRIESAKLECVDRTTLRFRVGGVHAVTGPNSVSFEERRETWRIEDATANVIEQELTQLGSQFDDPPRRDPLLYITSNASRWFMVPLGFSDDDTVATFIRRGDGFFGVHALSACEQSTGRIEDLRVLARYWYID